MNAAPSLDRRVDWAAWGLLFIWWGLRWWLLAALPNGVGLLGTGLILLGLIAVRTLNGIPTRRTTTYIGILALASGGVLSLATEAFDLSVEIPWFESGLIVVGFLFLIKALGGQQGVLPA